MQKTVAVIVGSARKESLNLKMAKTLIKLAPENLALEILQISDLPIYNEDADVDPSQAWIKFRNALKPFDAVLFVTPEYNRSVPALLKNAIDIGSRPQGQSAWSGKPAAIVTVSPGATGGFGANHHLRQSLVFLNMPAMAQPEAYIGGAAKLFDDKGNISVDSTREFMRKFMHAFGDWIFLISKEK